MLRNLGICVNMPAEFKCYSRCSRVLCAAINDTMLITLTIIIDVIDICLYGKLHFNRHNNHC